MMGLWVLDYGSMIWDAIYKKSVEHILLHARCAVFSKSSYRPLGKRKRNIARKPLQGTPFLIQRVSNTSRRKAQAPQKAKRVKNIPSILSSMTVRATGTSFPCYANLICLLPTEIASIFVRTETREKYTSAM